MFPHRIIPINSEQHISNYIIPGSVVTGHEAVFLFNQLLNPTAMTRRMVITVVNTSIQEKWGYADSNLEHGKWMENNPPQIIPPNGQVTISSEKQSGATYGTTGWICYKSTINTGNTLTITWNKPYGTDPTTCSVSVTGMGYIAKVASSNFGTKEGKEIGKCVVTISKNPYPVPDPVDTKNWMGKLPANTTLNNIIMPGSHDAGMSELHNCSVGAGEGNTKTQELDIKGQLEAGSRYFDIRVDYDKEMLITYHRTDIVFGWGCSGQLLETVLKQTVTFLSEHKTETAILKFSHIRGNKKQSENIKNRIKKMLESSEFSGFMFKGSDSNLANLNLSSSAGKFVAVMDYDEDISTEKGFFRFHDGFQETDKNKGPVCEYRGLNVTVCDLYSNTDSYPKMSADQISKWDKYAGFGKDYLFLVSWTLTAGSGGSIRDLARVANDHLPAVLNDQVNIKKKGKPNIVYIDFVNMETTQAIIGWNF